MREAQRTNCWRLEQKAKLCSGTCKQIKKLTTFEPHTEDIVQVRFHPAKPSVLFTGSIDGLVYALDTALGTTEDEATIAMFNIDQPVSEFDFFGPSKEFMHVQTTVETFSLWNVSTLDRLANYTDARSTVAAAVGNPSIDFLAGFHFDHNSNQLAVLAGNSSGDLNVCTIASDGNLQSQGQLSGGHVEMVRCFYWDPQDAYIITGGEDSRLCCWRREDSVLTPQGLHSNAKALKADVGSGESRFTPY